MFRAGYRPLLPPVNGDVDDHVLLAAHVAGLADLPQDLVRGHPVPIGRPLGVQQERVVDAEPALHDRRPVGDRQPLDHRLEHLLGRGQHGVGVDPGRHVHRLEHGGQDLGRRVAGAGAQRAQRAVDLPGAVLVRDDRVGHAQRQVLVAVEADLRVVAQFGDQRLHPVPDAVRQQRAGRVDDVHALAAGVGHDPRLLGQLVRPDPVREHQEADGFHAQLAGGGEMLDRHVGLGAVGGHPGDLRADTVHLAAGSSTVPRPGSTSTAIFARFTVLDGGLDQLGVGAQAEAVVERRAGQPVAVGHLDDLQPGRVQRAGDLDDVGRR